MVKIFENSNMQELMYFLFILLDSEPSRKTEFCPTKASQSTLTERINPF